MDTAVALVQAYLHVNGYFTVSEFPVLETFHGHGARTVTDLDILAVRFPEAGEHLLDGRALAALPAPRAPVDPVLAASTEAVDMIVGEVKEGPARLNHAMRNPMVVEVALARFGCCRAEHAHEVTRELLATGRTATPAGHVIRLVAFGDAPEGEVRAGRTTVPMHHVVRYLQDYLRQDWAVLRHAQLHDPALAVLALLEKWNLAGTR